MFVVDGRQGRSGNVPQGPNVRGRGCSSVGYQGSGDGLQHGVRGA